MEQDELRQVDIGQPKGGIYLSNEPSNNGQKEERRESIKEAGESELGYECWGVEWSVTRERASDESKPIRLTR